MAWSMFVVAGLFQVARAFSMKQPQRFTRRIPPSSPPPHAGQQCIIESWLISVAGKTSSHPGRATKTTRADPSPNS